MKAFTELFNTIDETTRTNLKIDALIQYFKKSNEEDSLWCIALFTGRKPKRSIKTTSLKMWAAELANIPLWLFDESYNSVGDLAETISLILPLGTYSSTISLSEIIHQLILINNKTEEEKKIFILKYWNSFSTDELFIFNKIITGSFRVGVSQQIIFKALAKAYSINENVIAHRLIGNWTPENSTLKTLLSEEGINADDSKPYPFYLAYQLELNLPELGDINDWQLERKFDGIRGQIIFRNNEIYVWSRGEELVTDKFPEFISLKNFLNTSCVLDGEILPVKNGNILAFSEMQKRIGRKNLSVKILKDLPLAMICYDLLELDGKDLRDLPLYERRALLENLIKEYTIKDNNENKILYISEKLITNDWDNVDALRLESKQMGCEGLMLKRLDSIYETGRKKGKWWKWKVDPYSIDAVLIYAQRGHGRRADLFTDFTFAVWDGDTLVPFTKAYSGLTDKELVEVDRWIKKNTIDKFGPVRSVNAELVFELAFEGINLSSRHKSGVALRFPRILRWRKDKPKEDANTKQDLLNLLNNETRK